MVPAATGIEIHISGIAVSLEGKRLMYFLDIDYGRITLCQDDVIGTDHTVVLFVQPALAGDVRTPEQSLQDPAAVIRLREISLVELSGLPQVLPARVRRGCTPEPRHPERESPQGTSATWRPLGT